MPKTKSEFHRVTVRTKPRNANSLTLYLDVFPPYEAPGPTEGETRTTRRKFIKRYIHVDPKRYAKYQALHKELRDPETDAERKEAIRKRLKRDGYDPVTTPHPDAVLQNENTEALAFAHTLRTKLENDLNKKHIYNPWELKQMELQEKGEQPFIPFFYTQAKNDKNNLYAVKFFEGYAPKGIRFKDLTPALYDGYVQYLQTSPTSHPTNPRRLAPNTQAFYLGKLRTTLQQAFDEGYIPTRFWVGRTVLKSEKIQIVFLNREEIDRLQNAPCELDFLKKACFLSMRTGLRIGDVRKLEWKDLVHFNDRWHIDLKTQKTKDIQYLPITDLTYTELGEPGEGLVFPRLRRHFFNGAIFHRWLALAQIDKRVTFHTFRKTYATQLLINGVAVTTVMKLLGHKNISTTMRYAKVVDSLKIDAVATLDF